MLRLRQCLYALLSLTIMVQALLPYGAMPVLGDAGAIRIQMCSGVFVDLQLPAPDSSAEATSCPWSGLLGACPLASSVALVLTTLSPDEHASVAVLASPLIRNASSKWPRAPPYRSLV